MKDLFSLFIPEVPPTGRRHEPMLGERRLMLAVIEQVVEDYDKPHHRLPADRHHRCWSDCLPCEARRWLDDPEDGHLYSFLAICDVFAIDAARVRVAILTSHRRQRSFGVA